MQKVHLLQATAMSSSQSIYSHCPDEAKNMLIENYNKSYAFHTSEEMNPYWLCNLDKAYPITRICFFHRKGYEDKIKDYKVSFSYNLKDWVDISKNQVAISDKNVIELKFGTPIVCKYIKFEVLGFASLALHHIELFEDANYCVCHSFLLKEDKHIISDTIMNSLRANKYENAERRIVLQTVQPEDKILEIGAGLGFISTIIQHNCKIDKYLCVEANLDLCEIIKTNHKLNNVTEIELLNGVLVNTTKGIPQQESTNFYVRKNFWGSSLEPGNHIAVKSVPCLDFGNILATFAPTYIICDIEGGEYDLFNNIILSSVKKICIELHGSEEKRIQLCQFFLEQNFTKTQFGNVYYFEKK